MLPALTRGRWQLRLTAALIPFLLPLLAHAAPSPSAPGSDLAVAKLELAALLDSLETALDAAPFTPPLAAFEDCVTANWLEGQGGPVDLELARRRCRPRYAALAEAYAALARCLAGDAADRAAVIYERRVLPRALEISICLVAAEDALGESANPVTRSGGMRP
jgi:hypothetical protein